MKGIDALIIAKSIVIYTDVESKHFKRIIYLHHNKIKGMIPKNLKF